MDIEKIETNRDRCKQMQNLIRYKSDKTKTRSLFSMLSPMTRFLNEFEKRQNHVICN